MSKPPLRTERYRWVYWLAVILGILGHLLGAGGTAAAAGKPRLLAFSTRTAHGPSNDAVADIESKVRARAAEGFKDALHSGEPVAFDSVIDDQNDELVKVIRGLRSVIDRDVSGELGRVLDPKRQSEVHFVALISIAVSEPDVTVEFELYALQPQGGGKRPIDLLSRKQVTAARVPSSDLEAQVREAATLLASSTRDRTEPVANIVVSPAGSTLVGEPLVLDGSGSSDPDHDAVRWLWTQVSAPPDGTLIAPSGRVERRLQVTPRLPGSYRFHLDVVELLDNKRRGSKDVIVQVVAAPVADVGDDELIPTTGRCVPLSGTKLSGKAFHWRQVQGPQVTLAPCGDGREVKRPETCDGATCGFTPSVAGKYKFQLVAEEGKHTRSKEITFLVAPPPIVDPGATQLKTHPQHALKFPENGTVDTVGQPLRILWRATDATAHVTLLDSTERRPTFIADEYGTYKVEMTVGAPRNFADKELWAYERASLLVQVQPAEWTLLGLMYAQKALREAGNASLLVVPTVGVHYRPLRRFGVSVTQQIVRFLGDVERPLSDVVEWGGTTNANFHYYWVPRPNFSWTTYVGGFTVLSDLGERGGAVGITATVRMDRRFQSLIDAGIRASLFPNDDRVIPIVYVALGVGYEP